MRLPSFVSTATIHSPQLLCILQVLCTFYSEYSWMCKDESDTWLRQIPMALMDHLFLKQKDFRRSGSFNVMKLHPTVRYYHQMNQGIQLSLTLIINIWSQQQTSMYSLWQKCPTATSIWPGVFSNLGSMNPLLKCRNMILGKYCSNTTDVYHSICFVVEYYLVLRGKVAYRLPWPSIWKLIHRDILCLAWSDITVTLQAIMFSYAGVVHMGN